MRKVLYGLAALAVFVALLYALGPRTPVDTTISFDQASIGDDVEAYLADTEAAFDDIRADLGKQIVWADPEGRARTPLSIVYVHGFSASPGEIRPLPDIVARELGANLYLTRLAGHGRTGDAMAEATVNAWVNDIAEAIAVGRILGERVVLIGTSTGATLTTWAAAQPALAADVAALVNISPNYGVRAAGSRILTMPWGAMLADLLIGDRRAFQIRNDLHARYWTSEYPTSALMPMAALVELARTAEIHNIQIPALFVYSPDDMIVRTDRTADIVARWGAATEVEIVGQSGDPANHVIAGEALSPETTAPLAARIADYLRNLP
jgi:alpha-beta hydrolase superfamily lysophospholipase